MAGSYLPGRSHRASAIGSKQKFATIIADNGISAEYFGPSLRLQNIILKYYET